jgi:hypothetical protein
MVLPPAGWYFFGDFLTISDSMFSWKLPGRVALEKLIL